MTLRVAALVCLTLLAGIALLRSQAPEGFRVALTIGKTAYSPGEPIRAVLEVSNTTDSAVSLEFLTAQRYEFVILDEQGEEVWRWSDGKMFAQAFGHETLDSKRPTLRCEETIETELPPGIYTIEGTLTDSGYRPSARLRFKIE